MLLLVTVVALLLAPLAAVHAAEVSDLLARCRVTKARPTPLAQAAGYGTMSQCLLLGNGNLMVSVAGGPETITLFLGKTDFWRDRGHGGSLGQSGNVLPGWVNLTFPAMADAQFAQVQDMALAEVQTKLTKGGDVSRHMRAYLAELQTLDENVGRLLKRIDELGLRENTIVVFSSDRGPAHIREAAQADPEAKKDGAKDNVRLNAMGFAGPFRGGRWKFHHPQSTRGEMELYEIVADPGEQRSLAAEHPDTVKTLSGKLQAWQAALPDPSELLKEMPSP